MSSVTETVNLGCKDLDFEFDPDNPEEVWPNTEEIIGIVGGCPPFSWEVTGDGYSFENATTTERTNTLLIGAEAYGTAEVTILDACGRAGGSDFGSGCEGLAFAYASGNPATIDDESTETITVTGGYPPFTWSVTGTGFSFAEATTEGRTNTLIADGTECDDAEVTVDDSCNGSVTGTVAINIAEFVYYAGNPTTIDSNEEKTITVTGGLAPFTWATTCPGTSFVAAETQERTNTLQSEACPGYTGTITVTDACGSEVTGTMTAEIGSWIFQGSWLTERVSEFTCREFSEGSDLEVISGGYKWVFKGFHRMCSVELHEWPDGLPEGCTPPFSTSSYAGGSCTMDAYCRTCPPCEVVDENCTQPCKPDATYQWYSYKCYKWEC